VDGQITDWDLANDFFVSMYRAWNPNKKIETNLYLRYDCQSGTMFALVLSAGDWPVLVDGDAWISINGNNNKVSFTNFAWVDQGYDGNSSHAKGWEASFSLAQGDYTIVAHTNVDDGGSQTSGTPNVEVGMTVICGGSTAVTLTNFAAQWTGGGAAIGPSAGSSSAPTVKITWETATEVNNLGFNIYRSDSQGGPWTKLNANLIPSQVPPGSPVGASYEYTDSKVVAGTTYFYLLEDVDSNGTATQHGPIQPQ
jgi:hypothetical protein